MSGRERGYTLLEIVVSVAVLGVFLLALVTLEWQMRSWERRLPINYQRHPQIASLLSKLRRDVQDAHGADPYRTEHDGYTMSGKTLILESVQENGGVQTIVWDFTTPGVALRRAYNVGLATNWYARGIPEDFSNSFKIDAVGIPGRPWGVRITASDGKGAIAIDQILQPRAHD